MESQDRRLHGVHQKHWQEYQASHCLAQRGNASMLTCQKISEKKAYECSKTESQRGRGYPHIAAIMRLLSTLTEPGAFIQGWDVPWRKEHCTLSKKYWIAHRAISLGGTLDWCTLIKGKMTMCLDLVEKQIILGGSNGQRMLTKEGCSLAPVVHCHKQY